jgi:hypothetical protein
MNNFDKSFHTGVTFITKNQHIYRSTQIIVIPAGMLESSAKDGITLITSL